MDLIKRMYLGATTVLMGSTLALLLATVNVILMARLLEPTSFGYLSTLLALCGILLIPTDFGGETTTAKFISEGRFSRERLIGTSFCIKALVSLVCIVLYLSTLVGARTHWNISQSHFNLYLFIVPFLLITESFFRSGRGIFQGIKRVDLMALSEVFWRGLQLIFCIGLILMGFGVFGAAVGYGLASLMVFLGGIFYYPKKSIGRPEKNIAQHFLKFSSYAFISLAMYAIILLTDILCISYFCPPEEVAYYNIAAKVSIFVIVVPAAIQAILYPMISERYGFGDVESASELYLSSIRAIFYSAGFSVIVLLIASPWIIDLFLPMYQPALYPLYILVFAYFCGSFGYSYITLLNGWNQPRISAKIAITQAVLNVAANIILVPNYGYASAAFASLASFLLGLVIGTISVRKLIGAHVTLSTFLIKKSDLKEIKKYMAYFKEKTFSK